MATLEERGLIEECGRSRFGAILYRTTPLFEKLFGLESLDALPDLSEFEPERRGAAGAAREAAEGGRAARGDLALLHNPLIAVTSASRGARARDNFSRTRSDFHLHSALDGAGKQSHGGFRVNHGGLATVWRLAGSRETSARQLGRFCLPVTSTVGRRLALFAASFLVLLLLNAAGPLLAKASAYSLLLSKTPDRTAPVALGGQTVSDNIYVFVANPQTGITNVRFWLDNPARTGTPTKTETGAPYDFAGSNADATKTAIPYDTKRLVNGTHTISAAVAKTAGGTDILTASFTVNNSLTPPPPDGCSPAPCAFSIQLSSRRPPAPARRCSRARP